MNIRQGNRTVAEFSIDFRTLARRSEWNAAAVVDAFFHGLADYIKDELVSHDLPESLDEAVALAVRIDRRVQARRREKGRQSQPFTRTRSSVSTSLPPPSHPQDLCDQPESMEIGRAILSPEERQ